MKSIRLLDSSQACRRGDVLVPFALEELECRRTGEDGVPTLHTWRHERAFVLGLRDRKLPKAQQGMAWLEQQGYDVGVRNSGGAAVPLDEGVLNITLILPKGPGQFGMHDEFQLMADIVGHAVRACGLNMQAGEIAGSYCPGQFDLSVGGRKFCGIAQRRLVRSVAVQAFVNVTGSGAVRASLVRSFYDRAGGGGIVPEHAESSRHSDPLQSGQPSYPDVREERMASLQELLQGQSQPLTVQSFAELVKQSVQRQLGGSLLPSEPAADEEDILSMAALMRSRYNC